MKKLVEDAIEHERTDIGKNTLHQLLEAIQ